MYWWRVYSVARKLLQKDSEKGGGLMKMGEYHIGDILFSTANPNYAYTVLEIDHGGNRVKLIPNYRRDGDKIRPDCNCTSYWRNANADNLYLRVRKVAKVV